MSNQGNYIVGEQAEAAGVGIYPGFPATGILSDANGAVTGVATGDLGAHRDGTPGLNTRVKRPPDDGKVWTAKKVAAVIAAALGQARVAEQRGWEALRTIGWTDQEHPASEPTLPAQMELRASRFSQNSQRRAPSFEPGAGTRFGSAAMGVPALALA